MCDCALFSEFVCLVVCLLVCLFVCFFLSLFLSFFLSSFSISSLSSFSFFSISFLFFFCFYTFSFIPILIFLGLFYIKFHLIFFTRKSFVKYFILKFIREFPLNWPRTSSRKIYKRIPFNFDMGSFYKGFPWEIFFPRKSFVNFF